MKAKRILRGGFWTAAAALFAACAGTVATLSSGTTSSGSSGGTGGSGGGCGSAPLPCCEAGTSGPCCVACGTTSGTGGTGGACGCGPAPRPCCRAGSSDFCCIVCDTIDGGEPDGGTTCGGLSATGCPPDQYCVFPDHQCGNNGATGVCQPRPQDDCEYYYKPVCPCDGAFWDNDCFANVAGLDISDLHCCSAIPDTFACGNFRCLLGKQYCQVDIPPDGGITLFSCPFFPPACDGGASCDCLPIPSPCAGPCGGTCSGPPGGPSTVTCCH